MVTTIDQKIAELLNNFTVNDWPVGNLILCLIALVLSVVLCGMIGIEREWRGRSAGLRTHLLVGIGSCMVMIISIYGFPAVFSMERDVARLAAQIITGVGFLGAGAIIHRNSGIKGLTTAGTIWAVMAIGIACGSFNFILAVAATLIILLVLISFKKVEAKINSKNPVVVLTAQSDKPILSKVIATAKEYDCVIHGLSTDLVDNSEGKLVQVTFQVVFSKETEGMIDEFLGKLGSELNASSIHLLNHR